MRRRNRLSLWARSFVVRKNRGEGERFNRPYYATSAACNVGLHDEKRVSR